MSSCCLSCVDRVHAQRLIAAPCADHPARAGIFLVTSETLARMTWTVACLIDEIDLLGSRGLSRAEYFAELSPRLRNVIDNDASCWHTLDPHTRLLTSDAPDDLIERGIFTPDEAAKAGEMVVRSEYMVDDVNTFAGLASRRVPVGVLDHVTRGAPPSSARYRDVLAPADIPHELRAAFVIRGRVWGAVHIARSAASGPFEQRDADALAGAAGAIARGIRASLRFDAARRATGIEAPGLVILGPRDEIELITPPARELLSSIQPELPAYSDDAVPTPVLALASFVAPRPTAVPADRTSSRFPAPTAGSRSTPRCPATAASRSSSSERPVRARRPFASRHSARRRASARSRPCWLAGCPARRWPRRSSCRRTPSRTTSRACTRRSASPHGRSSSRACSWTSTCPRWCVGRR
jgi:hypothetical protein